MLTGCQKKSTERENMNENITFSEIQNTEKSDKKEDFEYVTKIAFQEAGDMQSDIIAMDFEKMEIYHSIYTISDLDDEEPLRELNNEDISQLKKILQDTDDWKEVYGPEEDEADYEDGYGWCLFIVYKDGKVKQYIGSGESKEEVTPENFDEFADNMKLLIKE